MTDVELVNNSEGLIVLLPSKKILGVVVEIRKDSVIILKPKQYGDTFTISNTYRMEYSKEYLCMCLSKWGYKILNREDYVAEVI